MPSVVLLSQGDEIVTGQTVDTNAAFLAEQLTAIGFDVVRHVSVGDRLGDLVSVFQHVAPLGDVVLCTGGLGPTEDDLTAEAVATAFQRPLQPDAEALAAIEAMFARYGRAMAPSNRKQALLPTGSERLDNARGTAPGFALEVGTTWFACMPGVPSEMRGMFAEQILPRLTARFQLSPGRLITLRTTGVGESTLQDRIGAFSEPDAVLAYRTSLGENQIKLRIAPHTTDVRIQALVSRLHEAIGSPVFTIEGLGDGGGSLPEVVGRTLHAQGHTLAVAESCTGGRISALCTGVDGASAWFLEGAVTYANEAKVRALQVPIALLEAHGAVSEPVARAMAEGMRQQAQATFGLATTGIAGPTGGTPNKPVGTVHLALATPSGTVHHEARFGGSRARIQALAAHAALDLLRRHLQGVLSRP